MTRRSPDPAKVARSRRDDDRVRVLVFEPDGLFRGAIAKILERRGFWVRAVADGEGAREALDRDAPAVVIASLDAPRPDGWDLMARAGGQIDAPPFIVISADEDPSTVVKAMRRGAIDFLPKPLSIDELVQRGERAMDSLTLRRHLERVAPRAAEGWICESAEMKRVRDLVERVGRSAVDAVLVVGESGSGKEEVARALHQASPRARHAFVAVNAAALPETMMEAELFGHVAGAFTGAAHPRSGLLGMADGGTLLLDELTEMAVALQPKLLRVLEARSYYPVGSDSPRSVDVRVVATSNRVPREAVEAGLLREDLFYRLARVVIDVPPLRRRPADILPMARRFLADAAELHGVDPPTLTGAAERRLLGYRWPGNVRELKHAMERAILLHPKPTLDAAQLDLGPPSASTEQGAASLDLEATRARVKESVERALIRRALDATGGSISQAAELLNVSRTTLWNRMRKYGLEP